MCDIWYFSTTKCLTGRNWSDDWLLEYQASSEFHNEANNKLQEPNQDIRDSPLPSQETGICDISQERVADDNCKDKRDNQNEQDSESHNIAIHVANEPNQDIRYSLLPSQETGICDISQERVADDNCKNKRDNQNEQDSESHNIAIHIANEPNQDIRDNPLPSQETGICDISQECVADDNCKDKRDNQNEQDSESHDIAIYLVNEPNQDIRDSPLPSQEAGICDLSQERFADDKDKRDNQNEQDGESHNIAIHVTDEPNQDIRDSPLPSQEMGICDISQDRVADDNCKDKRDNQNEQDSESLYIAIHVANEPNQNIRDSPLPSQETGICDISQERVADANCKDKTDNQNEQDSESHNIAIHVTDEPNQDIRDSPLPGQETGICEITDQQFNDYTLGKMDILEN